MYFCRMKNDANDKVRHEIIIAATGVFETYGFDRVSMQDISKASRKGRSTLYYYFKNKMEVLDAVAEKLCGEIFARCEAQVEKEAPIEVNIENFHKQKLQETKTLTSKFHLVLEDLKKDPSMMFTKLRLYMDEEIDLIYKIITWGIEKREVADLNEEDMRFLAGTIVTAFKSFEQEILLFDRFPNMEAKLSWLAMIFCKGLR
jgi:AcrR family transcriptional regulator